MKITELNKLLVCALIIIGAIILLAMGKIDNAVGATMIMTPLGYVFGNGHGILSAREMVEKRSDENEHQ